MQLQSCASAGGPADCSVVMYMPNLASVSAVCPETSAHSSSSSSSGSGSSSSAGSSSTGEISSSSKLCSMSALRAGNVFTKCECKCGHTFCFICCSTEEHAPALCSALKDWQMRSSDLFESICELEDTQVQPSQHQPPS